MNPLLAVLIAAQAQSWQVAVDSLARRDQFSGVVLVARNGVPQFERAYGMADREAGRPSDLETRGGGPTRRRFVAGAGGAPGLNAVMEGDLPGGYDVIVMANLDPPAAERVAQLIRAGLGIEAGPQRRRRP